MIIAAGVIGGGVASIFLLWKWDWRVGMFAGIVIGLFLTFPVINHFRALELQVSARRIREETRYTT
jgi:uncharacterized integral membrane protein